MSRRMLSDQNVHNESIDNFQIDQTDLVNRAIPKHTKNYRLLWKKSIYAVLMVTFLKRSAMKNSNKFKETMTKINRNNNAQIPLKRTCISYPNSFIRKVWTVYMSLLLMYTAIPYPVILAFYEIEGWNLWFRIDLVIDISFLLDIIWTLNTAIYDKRGNIVTDRKIIFMKYLKSWLVPDLLASLPFGLLEIGEYNNLIRLVRLRILTRFFRFTKLRKNMDKLKSIQSKLKSCLALTHHTSRTIGILLLVIFFHHLMACLWRLSYKFEGYSSDSWLVRHGYNHTSYPTQYLASVYWALTTSTAVGYGDISPITPSEKLLTILCMIIGVYLASSGIGYLTHFITDQRKTKNFHMKNREVVQNFCENHLISKSVYECIIDYLWYDCSEIEYKHSEFIKVFKTLPLALQYEIACNMHKGAILEFDLFQFNTEMFVANIAPMLKFNSYGKFSSFYMKGEAAKYIYFVLSGTAVCKYNKNYIFTHHNDYFGEYEMIFPMRRVHDAYAMNFCELLTMSSKVLLKIKNMFPQSYTEIRTRAKSRGISFNKIPHNVKSCNSKISKLMSLKSKIIQNKESLDRIVSTIENMCNSSKCCEYSVSFHIFDRVKQNFYIQII